MAEITGGNLNYVVTADVEQLKKSLSDGEGHLLGFSSIAEKAGASIDNSFSKSGSRVKDFTGIVRENIIIQKQVIKELESEIKAIEKRAQKIAPGNARAAILSQAKGLEKELASEKAALSDLEIAMSKTAVTSTTLGTKLAEAKNRLAELNLAAKEGKAVTAEQFHEAEAEVKKYGEAISDTNARARALTAGTIGSLAQGLSMVTGTMAVGTSLMGAFGGKSEELNQIMLKTQALLAATVTLQEIKNTTVQKGGVISGIMAVQEMARARGADAAALASGRATVAQRAWNLVANANPYLLLATAILTVVGAIGLYVVATNQAEAKTRALIDLNKNIADSAAEPLVAYRNLQGQWNALGNDLKAKEKFVKDNKDAFEKLGVEVNNVTDAENVLKKGTAAFVQSMILRAKATAMQQKAVEDTRKSLELEAEYRRKYIDKDLTVGEKLLMPTQAASRRYAKSDAEEIRKLNQGIYDDSLKQLEVQKKIEEIGKGAGFKTPGKEQKGSGAKPTRPTSPAPIKPDDILPAGSVAEIQKRLAEIDKALSKSTNDDSTKLLKARRIDVALELAAAEKKIRIKSFDEEIDDTKKQIELRDKLLQAGYSKENVDAMLPDVKDKSYISYLEETELALKKLKEAGDNTEQTATNLTTVQAAINEFKGYSTFIDDVAKSIENLKSRFSGSELLSELEKYKNIPIPGATEAESNARRLAAEKAIEAENKAIEDKQQQFYADFLKEKETFEQKKKAIDEKYDSIDASINNSDKSADEKARLLAESGKARGQEYSQAFIEGIANSEMWLKAFGEINEMTNSEIRKSIEYLTKQLESEEVSGNPEKTKIITDQIKSLQSVLNNNPFEKIRQDYKKMMDVINDPNASLESKLGAIQGLFNSLSVGLQAVGDAFGGFDDATNDAIGNIMAIGNSAFDLAKSIASGDVAGMISAGVKLIGSIGKALSGDQKKERNIKRQAAALKELENRYNALAFAAERAFGAQKYDGQRDLIKNLQQQKIAIEGMMRAEQSKKKADKGKIAEYQSQIQSINQSIASLKEGIIKDVLQTDLVDAASKVGDALVDAFGRGEDSVKSLENAANDMIKNLLRNQLNLALQNKMKPILDQLLASSGFNQDGTGTFTGLTPEQIAAFKAQVVAAGQSMQGFLEGYSEIFGALDPADAQGLKGDIKGISEKTAGALEAQINAMRIIQVDMHNISKNNQQTFIASLQNLVMIEFNTRNLIQIRQDISEMNGKMSKGLAGIGGG